MMQKSGITIEGEYTVIGGAKGGGGAPRQPVIQPDSIRSLAVIEVVEALGEGEIEGFATADPLESIYLDDTPIKSGGNLNFTGVSFDYRTGTQSQTYMPGTIAGGSASIVGVGVNITHVTPVIRRIQDVTTDAVRVTLIFSALMRADISNGDRLGTSVQVDISVSLDLGASWIPADLKGRNVISGKTESPYERSFLINLKSFGDSNTYDIKVSRISPDPGPSETSDFKWESLTKMSFAKLRYPNTAIVRLTFDAKSFNNIPKRSYLVKGIKVRVPVATAYNAAARTYTGNPWNGNFTTAWTRNPAWIFYDIVTNPRYGLGELVNPVYMDKWTLYTIAQRCDDRIPDGLGGQECRYSMDLVLQTEAAAKQVIMDIASAFDSMAYWGNKAVKITQDAPKPVSALFVPANVVKGRFSYASSARQVRYTAALVQWNDPDDQYRIATEYVDDQTGIARYGYREKQIATVGCTSRGQANRAGKRILLTSRLETDAVSFNVGLDGLVVDLGQVIRIADPLRSGTKRQGGRVLVGATTTSVPLDAPVTLTAGINYKIAVIDSTGSVIEGLVSNAAGTTSTITVSPALASAPIADTTWIVYNPAEAGKLYRIVSISELENKENGFFSISAVQYNFSKYALIDSLRNLPPLRKNPFIQNGVVPPSGLQFSAGIFLGNEGIKRYIDVWWSASTDPFLRGYRLIIRFEHAVVKDIEIQEQSYRIQNPSKGTWNVTLQAVSSLGRYSTSISADYVLGELYLVESVSVTQLALVGGGNNFAGRSPEFTWDTDALAVIGISANYAQGSGGQSPWFRDYQVDVYSGVSLLRSDFVTESHYVYTYEKNLQDGGPRRTVTITVRARDMFGRYSKPATITVSNPLPTAISTVSIYAGFKSLIVKYNRPADNDWAGVMIFLSTATGFTPSVANRVYSDSDTVVTIPNLTEDTPYFIRLAAYDSFYSPSSGVTDCTITLTEYTKTISSSLRISPTEVKQNLQAALQDPAVTPLIFEADTFAVTLNGINKTPFIIGTSQGQPAILLDSEVVVTGRLSADQLVGGRIAATENLIIGNGNCTINGDGSIIVYDGDDSIANRDFAMLSGGTLTFQRYRGGAYLEYKTVRRTEFDTVPSGTTVTLPGYWDSQPKIVPIVSALRGYSAANSSSNQAWVVRADNLREIPIDGTPLVNTQLELILQGNATIGADYAVKLSGANAFDTQAFSSIGTDADCWVNWKFTTAGSAASCGLTTDPQLNSSDTGIDFCIRYRTNTAIAIYENGVQIGSDYSTATVTDTFTVERIGTTINYYKNGIVFASSTVAVGAILFFDSSLFAVNSGINSIQFWSKQPPAGSGSGRWKFDAVAELHTEGSNGVTTVASNSGVLNVNGWTSGPSNLQANTSSITVSVKFSSYRGDGISTYGFFYRSVSWTVQGWDGSVWKNLATKIRNITKAEHGQAVSDSNAVNIAATISKIRVVYTAYDTNGTKYSRGTNAYNYTTATITTDPQTGGGVNTYGSTEQYATLTTATWSVPSGWSIYAMRYVCTFNTGTFGGQWTNGYFNFEGAQVWSVGDQISHNFVYDTGQIARTSYNRTAFSCHGNSSGSGALGMVAGNYTAYLRKLITNSSTPANNFTLQTYSWATTGSVMLATGDLTYLAIGD